MVSRVFSLAAGIAAAAALCPLFPNSAMADGVYGRFRGDVTGAVGVGAGARLAQESASGAVTAELRLRFLDAAGPIVAGEWEPGGQAHVILGVELRPLFPALFFAGADFGNEWLDLMVQSVGLDVGVALGELAGNFGASLVVGAGLEVPLVLPSQWGNGVFLRLVARHRSAPSRAIGGAPGGVSEWFLGAVVVLRFSAGSGWVSREPARFVAPVP